MNLKDDFYTIEKCEAMANETVYQIHLNSSHIIYKAHFPSQPITPGVCIIEIAQELLQELLGLSLILTQVNNVKFLHVISPVESPFIFVRFKKIMRDSTSLKTQIEFIAEDTLLAKLSLSYKCEDTI